MDEVCLCFDTTLLEAILLYSEQSLAPDCPHEAQINQALRFLGLFLRVLQPSAELALQILLVRMLLAKGIRSKPLTLSKKNVPDTNTTHTFYKYYASAMIGTFTEKQCDWYLPLYNEQASQNKHYRQQAAEAWSSGLGRGVATEN